MKVNIKEQNQTSWTLSNCDTIWRK